MRSVIILFLLFTVYLFPQQVIKGRVLNRENEQSLAGATVQVKNTDIGAITDKSGSFTLKGIEPGNVIEFSYVGFNTYIKVYTGDDDRFAKNKMISEEFTIYLTPAIIPSQTVLVEASVGKEGFTPLTFEKIRREKISNEYNVQDIPQFLGELPSVNTYSENGNGIGYNYLSIRGFDQRRITVSINGIPQNDPEDHNVYWLDFPDLLESTELIQVQRGAGSGVFGYPAIGGSINIITSTFSNKPQANISASIGSFNTRKYAVNYSTGLLNNKYSLYLKLSNILSSGYRESSWVNFKSYHLSAVRYDKNLTTQLNIYGGPIEDGLAYFGLPKFALKDKELRKKNFSWWSAEADTFTYTVSRRSDELENFFQPHFELLNDYKFSEKVTFNSALFYVQGKGFFDYDGSWGDTSYFRLTSSNGFNPVGNPTDALIRAWVKNNQYGWLPRISIDHINGKFIAGAEFRIHRSDHWGEIRSAASLPSGFKNDYRYYSYNGAKDIYSFFVNESYSFSDELNIMIEGQLLFNKYKLYNEKYVGNEFTIKNTFFNPRVGINYQYYNNNNIYLTYARVSREPRLTNYYDAAESSGGSTPNFELNSSGLYDFTRPLVTPETMNDFELGTSFTQGALSINLNLYYMLFDNEIVKNGKLDRFGQPVTGNVKRTLHRGVELAALYKIISEFELFGNVTFGSNIIQNGTYFINDSSAIVLDNNRISGFPDLLSNFGVSYNNGNLFIKLNGKYVGAFYSDNYDVNLSKYLNQYPGFADYSDNRNDAYFTADLLLSYKFNLPGFLNDCKVFTQVNNLFDRLYSANAVGGEFFPAAERNFLVGIKLGM